jgi:hypothetical protein
MTLTIPAASRRGRRITRTTITGFFAATVLGTIACSGADSSTGPKSNRNPSGLYALMTVNKNAIPTQVYRGPYWYRDLYYYPDFIVGVTGGELTLDQDGSFHLAVDLRYAIQGGGDGAAGTQSYDGSYSVRGSDIVLRDATSSVTGSLQNGSITLVLDPGGTGTGASYRFQFVP